MSHKIIKDPKLLYLLCIISVSWEIFDMIMDQIILDFYYALLKYSITLALILAFIIVISKYGFILFLELIPGLNILPLLSIFCIGAILYVLYKRYQLGIKPSTNYMHVHKIVSSKYCQACGLRISDLKNGEKLIICPNCGFKLEENLVVECPICRSNKVEPITVCPKCQSRFHKRCFLEWVKIKGTCPICKNIIDSNAL